MVLDQTANFARESVTASIASGDTTISVADASTFPDPTSGRGEYNVVLWDTSAGRPDQDASVEIVRVTGRDTTNDDLTVTRGQEGTTAVSHPDTSAVSGALTDKTLNDIDSALLETIGSNVASGRPILLTAEGTVSVDPGDYADDSAALQAVVDAAGTGGGRLFLPSQPAGSATKWVLPSTVSISDPISIYGIGFSGQTRDNVIESSVGTGNATFSWNDVNDAGVEVRGLTWNPLGQNGSFLETKTAGNFIIRDCWATNWNGWFLRMNDATFDLTIDDCFLNGFNGGDKGILMETDGGNPPGDIRVGRGVTMISMDGPAWQIDASNGRNWWAGHWEGSTASGVGAIEVNDDTMHIEPSSYILQNGNGHAIRFNGTRFTATGGYIGAAGQDAIHIDAAGGIFRITEGIDIIASAVGGDSINVSETSPSDTSYLPPRNTVPGTVTYPSSSSGGGIYEGDTLIDDIPRTYIAQTRGTATTFLSSTVEAPAFDTTDTDSRGEVSNSTEFTPDKSGEYLLSGTIFFENTSDQDSYAVELRTTGGTQVGNRLAQTASSGSQAEIGVPYVGIRSLTAGTTYEVKAKAFVGHDWDVGDKSSGQITYNAAQAP